MKKLIFLMSITVLLSTNAFSGVVVPESEAPGDPRTIVVDTGMIHKNMLIGVV